MTTETSLLPLIVAELAEASAIARLHAIAARQSAVLVPLTVAPADDGDHVLEVNVPSLPPSLFLARTSGPPEAHGFALQLRPYGTAGWTQSVERARSREGANDILVARTKTAHKLSEQHTRSLTGGAPPPSKEVDLVGRSLAGGKLQLDACLAKGGIGAVYRATHRDLQKTVAVKVLRDGVQRDLDFCQRFHAEALAASSLNHPNLIGILDFGQEPDGLLYLSMEYLEGGSLEDLLGREARLSEERAIEIMLQVAAGLSHAHQRDIVHRDIKPANIMLIDIHDDDGQVTRGLKICDFGIALRPTSDDMERAPAGTPEYMSPEQCLGLAVDGRADIYSCGVMLYELVTGQLPFNADTTQALLRLQMTAKPQPPSMFLPDLNPALEAIIMRALAKAPDQRYASAREFRAALKALRAPNGLTPPSVAEFRPVGAQEVPPEAAPPSGQTKRADWLEDKQTGYDNFFASQATSTEARGHLDAEALATELAKSPVEVLNRIAALRLDPTFAEAAATLALAVKSLAKRGESTALGQVVRVMTAIYSEDAARGPEVPGAHSPRAHALHVLQAITDPTTLTPIAALLLSDATTAAPAALQLISWASVAGAHALYAARLGHTALISRMRFSASLRAIGPAAGPIVRAGLERLLPSNESSLTDVALAEDLLRSVPTVHDDVLGAVVARYARLAVPVQIKPVALRALSVTWGVRAIPALLASLQAEDEQTRLAALRGLSQLDAIDERIIEKLSAVLAGEVAASDDFKIAVIDAFARAGGPARPLAAQLVLTALGRDEKVVAGRPDCASPEVVLELARAAMSLAARDASALILARADACSEPLAGQLQALASQSTRLGHR